MKNEQSPILPDDYPVYFDYLYIVDGKLTRSDIEGTIKDLKHDLKSLYKHDIIEIRSYKIQFGEY